MRFVVVLLLCSHCILLQSNIVKIVCHSSVDFSTDREHTNVCACVCNADYLPFRCHSFRRLSLSLRISLVRLRVFFSRFLGARCTLNQRVHFILFASFLVRFCSFGEWMNERSTRPDAWICRFYFNSSLSFPCTLFLLFIVVALSSLAVVLLIELLLLLALRSSLLF